MKLKKELSVINSKLSKLDKPDIQDTAGKVGTSS